MVSNMEDGVLDVDVIRGKTKISEWEEFKEMWEELVEN